MASGRSTEERSPAVAVLEMVEKNQTKEPTTTAANATFKNGSGWLRRQYEKRFPTTTRTIDPTASNPGSSPWAQQAAMATTTEPAADARNRVECSGGPGWLARLIAP